MRIEEVWYGRSTTHILLRVLLLPFAAVYGLGWQAYALLYRLGLKKSSDPHCPVVCVGNLTVGGSGKTPTTIYIAKLLREMGYEVVIGMSGYGSPRSRGSTVAFTTGTNHPAPLAKGQSSTISYQPSEPSHPPAQHPTPNTQDSLSASEWGDEPAMMRWLLPDVPLIVGRDRVRAAQLCHQHYPNAILLMDDGLQHLPLKKHLTICIDEPRPPATRTGADTGLGKEGVAATALRNRYVLPAGPYREPRSALSRMDAVVSRFTAEDSENAEMTQSDIRNLRVSSSSEQPSTSLSGTRDLSGDLQARFKLAMRPLGFLLQTATIADPPARVLALCAIARPQKFLASLRSSGLEVAAQKLLPDHDPMAAGNLFEGLPPDLPVIVTAKDWVKLRERPDVGSRQIYVAMQEARIEPEAEFKAWLSSKLDEIAKA